MGSGLFSSIKAAIIFLAVQVLPGDCTHVSVQLAIVAVWIFRADIPVVQGFLAPSSQYPAPSRSDRSIRSSSLSWVFMHVVLSAFLGSTVARPEDSGKAIFATDDVKIPLQLPWGQHRKLPVSIFLARSGSYIPFISTFFMPFPYHQWLINWS